MNNSTQQSSTGVLEKISPAKLMVGIMIKFADGHDEWIDTDRVFALAWGEGEIGKRHANPHYTESDVPAMKDFRAGEAQPVCKWVCTPPEPNRDRECGWVC